MLTELTADQIRMSASIMASISSSTTVGRPKVNVDRTELKSLRSLRFSWHEVSVIMGVSVKTLQRRAKEWNIVTHSDVTDQRLKEIRQEVLSQFQKLVKL